MLGIIVGTAITRTIQFKLYFRLIRYSPYFKRKNGRSFHYFVPDFWSGTSGHWLPNSLFSDWMQSHFSEKNDFSVERESNEPMLDRVAGRASIRTASLNSFYVIIIFSLFV